MPRKSVVLLALSCLLAAAAGSLHAKDLRDLQFMGRVFKGFEQIYDLDYDEATETFRNLQEAHPQHPAPPLYLATALWLRELFQRQEYDLDHFIAPSYFDRPTSQRMPPPKRQAFFDLIAQSQALAQEILEQDPGHKDARYFLGSAHGILGSFAITIDRSRTAAFREGKNAYSIHYALVEEDSEYYDAYLTVGLYEYIVGSLPWYIRWIAAIVGYHGSKKRGFEYLDLASRKGQFVAQDARLLQMLLFVREKRYGNALANLRNLERKAPKNFIMKLNKAQILEKMNRLEQAAETYQQVVSLAESRTPNYDQLPLEAFRYTLGKKFLDLQRTELALGQLRLAAADPRTPARERALAYLSQGQALDLLARREQALASYRQVLELKNFNNSHRQAKRFLKRPYDRTVK